MVKKQQINKVGYDLNCHLAISQIIKAFHKPTRSMKERVFMRKSQKSAKNADSIYLIKSLLIYLVRQKKYNQKHKSDYLYITKHIIKQTRFIQ